jgi:hypothetical protein
MAGHRCKPGVDLPRLARADPVDRSPHVVKDPALGNTAQHPERLGQRIEQHHMGLQRIAYQVWLLFAAVMERVSAVAVMIERDDNIPPLDDLLAELDKARAIVREGITAWA